MKKKQLRKLDFVTSIILIIVSGLVIWEALKMPFHSDQKFSSPGTVPIILAIGLIVTSVGLLIFSIKQGGHLVLRDITNLKLQNMLKRVKNEIFYRTLLTFLLYGTYVFFLGKISFFILTSFFVAAFMIILRTKKLTFKTVALYVFLTLSLPVFLKYFLDFFNLVVP